jgi:hypothetical protein
MADEEETLEIPPIVPRVFYMVVLAAGVAFYVIWSALFDAWTDLAVYTISVIMIGFGILGTLLYSSLSKQAAADE